MANHSDDDSSSFGAPENFHITAENEDGSHWSGHQVKCPLCNYSRNAFYCRYCVRDGNFTHTSHHLAERYGKSLCIMFVVHTVFKDNNRVKFAILAHMLVLAFCSVCTLCSCFVTCGANQPNIDFELSNIRNFKVSSVDSFAFVKPLLYSQTHLAFLFADFTRSN